MADNDRVLKLGVDVDEASLKRAKQRLNDIQNAQSEVRAEFLRGTKSADAYSSELAALEKEAKTLNAALDRLEQPRKIDIQTDRFDKVSRDVALAGDAESALNTIGGAAGAFGGAGLQRGIGQSAEVLAVIEALPRLKESVAGLPQVVNAAGAAVGLSGTGFIGALGVAGVAVAGVSLVLQAMAKHAREARIEEDARNQAIADFYQFQASGGTSDEAQKNLADLQAQEKGLIATRAEQAAGLDEVTKNINQMNFFQERGIGSERNYIQARESAKEALEDTDEALANNQAEQERYTRGMDEGALAANDAAEAERLLREERTAGVLQDAAQAGDLATLKARANDLTREQIDSELEAIEIRKAGLETELAALEASGDTSEEVSQKIDQLRESLGFLGEQSDTLKNAQKTAKSSEAEKAAKEADQERTKSVEAAARKQEAAAQKAQQAADEARRAQETYTQAVNNARQGYTDAVKDIGTRLKDTFIDNNQKLEDTLNEQAIKFNESELAEEAEFQRDLAKIKRDAERAEKDAVRQRDFATLADVRENAADALEERDDAEEFANKQQLIEFKQQQEALGRERELADREALTDAERARRDAATARDRSMRDARSAFEQRAQMEVGFQQNSLRSWDGYFRQLGNMQQQLQGNAGRTSTSRTSSQSSSRISGGQMSMDDLSYITGTR